VPKRPSPSAARAKSPRRGRRPLAEPKVPRFSVAYLDRTTDPAADFYQFATGTWIRQNPVPADKTRWGGFDELLERNFYVIHTILEEAAAAPPGPGYSVRGQVGDLYASAMDTARRNELRFAPIAPDLARVEAVASVADLYRVAAELHRVNVEGLFDSYAYPDKKASGVYAFYIDQGGLSLPDREYYLDPSFAKVLTAYRAHLERSFRSLGDSSERAARASEAVLAIETELARASRTATERRDEEKNYHRLTVAELARTAPSAPWAQYLADREVGGVPHVVVGQPEFLTALDRAVAKHPIPEWKEYLRWQVLRDCARFLHEEAEAEWFGFFRRTLLGQEEPEPLWKRAAYVVDACLGEALGALYVERAFPPDARARMAQLVDDLRAVFKGRLEGRDWMGEATRRRALEKFARFTPKIGHPEKFRDYSSVRIARNDFLGNVRRAHAFEVHRRVVRVGQPVDRTEWGMTPPTVNAYFSPVFNEIVFPAGILQPPFFDFTLDDAVNYGGIGAVIGHEITHGYDDQGRKFDADGNLQNWWTESDAREFERRARRVVEQYQKYHPLPGLSVNGELTLGENLADLGGLSIAFEALERRLATEPDRRRTIDGFTPEQRFFLSWAQVWRQTSRPEETRRRLVVDTHSPGPFRARGALENLDAFFDAFGVKPGSGMWRPKEKRVAIW
jgi:putative endopeptidase